MPVIGYADRLSVKVGETINFMVSCDDPKFKVQIVRFIRGRVDSGRFLFDEEQIETPSNRSYDGKKQVFRLGSYIKVRASPHTSLMRDFTIQTWIYPTTPRKGLQGLLTNWNSSGGPGYGLFLNKDGCLTLGIRHIGEAETNWITSNEKLNDFQWYFVAATFDSSQGRIRLYLGRYSSLSEGGTSPPVEGKILTGAISECNRDVLIGAFWAGEEPSGNVPSGHFNGKIDCPCILSRALDPDEIRALEQGLEPTSCKHDLVAFWDFSREIQSNRIIDGGPYGLDAFTFNSPVRATTGHNWSGREPCFKVAPKEYGAIYFHDDDLDDACWETSFSFRIPNNFNSGVYFAKLEAGGRVDHVPFFVRPNKGKPGAKIVFLAPTLSYLAYSNAHLRNYDLAELSANPGFEYPSHPHDRYILKENLLSLYDIHNDGSGVCYASRLRPILAMRHDHLQVWNHSGKGGAHQLSADMHLMLWLEDRGFAYDVVTDEDLHSEGVDLLSPYRVMITGTHPEYWTERMLDSVESYLENVGRVMYLGGNVAWVVTSIDSEKPYLVEVRRGGPVGPWEAQPGESYHSTSGEPGGDWRRRGRSPQKMFGVGFTSQGNDRNSHYVRLPDSFDPRASFIFEGVGDDERIGDFENLIQGSGAAGYEIDRIDRRLGTPPDCLVLAVATDFSNAYEFYLADYQLARRLNVIKRVGSDFSQGLAEENLGSLKVAHMAYRELPRGGAVFSVGSIAWCGSLFYNHCKNNVSQITENVLRRFSSELH